MDVIEQESFESRRKIRIRIVGLVRHISRGHLYLSSTPPCLRCTYEAPYFRSYTYLLFDEVNIPPSSLLLGPFLIHSQRCTYIYRYNRSTSLHFTTFYISHHFYHNVISIPSKNKSLVCNSTFISFLSIKLLCNCQNL